MSSHDMPLDTPPHDYVTVATAGVALIDAHLADLVMDTPEDNALLDKLRETWELAKTVGLQRPAAVPATTRAAIANERLMVRKLYYLMCDLLDHVESDPEFRPANRDDYWQDIDSARKLIREVRENGWNR